MTRGGGGAAGRRLALRAALAPAVLALLAAVQIGLVFGAGLSPWKGGGFGMFASPDRGDFRRLVVLALEPDGEERVLPIPPALRRQRDAARELPTDARLRALARALAPAAPEARALRVEVWRPRFDRDVLHPGSEPLARATWDRPR